MDTVKLMDAKEKRKIGIICLIPSFPFVLCLAYYLVLLVPLSIGYHVPKSAAGAISLHYNTILTLLTIYGCAALTVLIYCLIHLIRIKTINSANKMKWALILVTFMPVSFVLFWYFQVRNEPRDLPVYPSIS